MDDKEMQKYRTILALDRRIRAAWYSIAEERGYMIDMWLGTSSHGTLAVRHYFHLRGV